MTNGELMLEGVYLMISGMGFVISFLIILVLALGLMSKIIMRFPPVEPIVPGRGIAEKQPTVSHNTLNVVMATAIHHYRQTHPITER
ncbi:OadG family transporter subunit [Pectobacteriaceae bacterium CE70]|nr:OadG family transporter subunit [Pectobacteriaceae bacterium C52]WJV66302.1 OadG family transporter subunit [Pectobacteriaceae bacterium CE70]WJY10309.1 OadG family transporter subunit [Pectobacteriaceae bacterium C80]